MPEVGNLPIPQKLLKQGVRDMLRISDARMSGTSYGTIVLHVAPEAARRAARCGGDEIELNVAERRLHLCQRRGAGDEVVIRRSALFAECQSGAAGM